MSARGDLLMALQRLYADLEAAKAAAAAEGDSWCGLAASWIQQAVMDAAHRAEAERVSRGEE